MPRRILSIAAAPGWKARVMDDEAPEGLRVVTLAAWALVEGAGATTEIVGVVQRAASEASPTGALALVDELPGFQGYAFTGVVTREADA